MDPMNLPAALEVRSFTRSWHKRVLSFGQIANPQFCGRGGRRGSRILPFEIALVMSCGSSVVIFICLYAFQRYCVFCAPARTSLFPTPPLLSPKVSVFPWAWVDGLCATIRRAKVLGLLSVQFFSKISWFFGPDPPTSQTDFDFLKNPPQ